MAFLATTRDISLIHGTILKGTCTVAYSYQIATPSFLDLNNCISNNCGRLDPNGGGFKASACDIRYENGILYATCYAPDGRHCPSSLDLNRYVSNMNGNLEFYRDGAVLAGVGIHEDPSEPFTTYVRTVANFEERSKTLHEKAPTLAAKAASLRSEMRNNLSAPCATAAGLLRGLFHLLEDPHLCGEDHSLISAAITSSEKQGEKVVSTMTEDKLVQLASDLDVDDSAANSVACPQTLSEAQSLIERGKALASSIMESEGKSVAALGNLEVEIVSQTGAVERLQAEAGVNDQALDAAERTANEANEKAHRDWRDAQDRQDRLRREKERIENSDYNTRYTLSKIPLNRQFVGLFASDAVDQLDRETRRMEEIPKEILTARAEQLVSEMKASVASVQIDTIRGLRVRLQALKDSSKQLQATLHAQRTAAHAAFAAALSILFTLGRIENVLLRMKYDTELGKLVLDAKKIEELAGANAGLRQLLEGRQVA